MNSEYENSTVERIVKMEWEMFQKVESLGGRANCQDEWPTFRIMRYSQFNAWPEELRKSYEQDLESAVKAGRNLITEKYAYMMEYSEKEYFKAKLEPFLPEVDAESLRMIDEITKFFIACEKSFAAKYPKLSGQGRRIEASDDAGGRTSLETYNRGELKTYSKKTLQIYLNFVRKCWSEGKNIAQMVKETTVKMYGYASIEDAENRL